MYVWGTRPEYSNTHVVGAVTGNLILLLFFFQPKWSGVKMLILPW